MMLTPGDVAIDYIVKKDPSAIVAAGVKLCVRYISPSRSNPKNLTAVERDGLLAAGLGLLLVWENSATDPLKGGPLGKVHGIQAANFAKDLGYPAGTVLIVAVDFDVQPAQMAAVIAYLSAFASLCPFPLWVYGKDTVVDAAVNAGVCVGGWQTVAWSHHRVSPNAFVLQHATPAHPAVVAALGSVDDNTVLRDFTAWSLTPDPIPQLSGGSHMSNILTNVDAGKYGAALSSYWLLMDDGSKRPIPTIQELAAHGGTERVQCQDATLDVIPNWAPVAAVAAIDYDRLAAAIAPLLPKTFDGSIHLSAAG